MSQSNFYIQKGTDAAKDIYATWGILVTNTENLNEYPNMKKPFTRAWAEEQGVDTWLPDVPVFDSKTINVKVSAPSMNELTEFLNYIIMPLNGQYTAEPRDGVFQFFNSYKMNGARVRFSTMKFDNEVYRDERNQLDVTLELDCPHGLHFAYTPYGTGKNGATFTIANGEKADFYFSDGTNKLAQGTAFTNTNFTFCIINPSSINAVTITPL